MSQGQTGVSGAASGYAHPEALVDVHWVKDNLGRTGIRLVEVDVDPELYKQGHVEGAVGWSWETDLCDQVKRDLLDREGFEKLCSAAGIGNDTTVILYGDSNNWFAAWAFWQFKIYGHEDVRLMNGGRTKWEQEKLPYTADVPRPDAAKYEAKEADPSLRAFRRDVEQVLESGGTNLVDVRSPDEFTGKVIAPPGLMETAQRAGHIPGARNIPWAMAAQPDGTFKPVEQLRELYEGAGVRPGAATIAYCRIGERSSHTWFVLKYLLGYPDVKNYDGSWTEWGNLVGAPVER
jgi:thiosulfate/3-mercaptopyruvate sulfurtransferase